MKNEVHFFSVIFLVQSAEAVYMISCRKAIIERPLTTSFFVAERMTCFHLMAILQCAMETAGVWEK